MSRETSNAVLQAQFQELSLVENDFKRDLAWAQQNLEGVRELKSRIGKQIFTQHTVSLTTSTNGQNSTGSPRS